MGGAASKILHIQRRPIALAKTLASETPASETPASDLVPTVANAIFAASAVYVGANDFRVATRDALRAARVIDKQFLELVEGCDRYILDLDKRDTVSASEVAHCAKYIASCA